MSRTVTSNSNLEAAREIQKSGFKTRIHSIVDENGVPFYADEVSAMFIDGKTASYIYKTMVEKYPNVKHPSFPALKNWLRRHAAFQIPAKTLRADARPDAMAFMYKALEAANKSLDMAIEMQKSQKSFPLPVVRQAAMAVIQMGEKVINAEKAIGAPPVMIVNSTTNIQNNINAAQNIIVSDPVRGKELLERFKKFEAEVIDCQENPIGNS